MFRVSLIIAFTLINVASSALAQIPQNTSATYDDWVVRCVRSDQGRTCEMAQQTQLKTNNEVVSVIALGATNKNAQTKVVFQVAVNIWVAGRVALAGGDGQTAIASNFTRCIPSGCFAETEVGQDVIQKLRAMKGQGTLRFEDANQKGVAIPVSFKGFNQAYEALLKQGAETTR